MMVATTLSASRVLSRIGTPLRSTSSANSAALPSMTGRPAAAPMLPSPRMAVPLVMIATVLSMAV